MTVAKKTAAKKPVAKKAPTKKENWYTTKVERVSNASSLTRVIIILDETNVYGPYSSKDEAIRDMSITEDWGMGDYLVFKDAEIITVTEKRTYEKKSIKI